MMKGLRSGLAVWMAVLLITPSLPSPVFSDAYRIPAVGTLMTSSAILPPLPFAHRALIGFLPVRGTAAATTHAALLSQPAWNSSWALYASEGLLVAGAALVVIFKILPAWRSMASDAKSTKKSRAQRESYDRSRRDFLRWAWGGGAALAALMAAFPTLRVFLRRWRGRPVAARPSANPRVFYITNDFPVQLAAPLETDEDRAYQIRAKVFAFLDRELEAPSSVGASSPQDEVWRALNAFRDAADHRLILMRDPGGRSGTVAACQPVWVDGRAEDTVFVTDAYVEPLLDRSLADPQNVMVRGALLTLFGKEGAIFTKVQTAAQHQRQTELLDRARNFRFNPAVPMTPEQEEAVRRLAAGLVDGETVGYHVADAAMTRFQLSPAALQGQWSVEPDPRLRQLWGGLLALRNRIGIVGANSRQRELSLRTRVLFLDVATQYPQLVNAVSLLTVVRNNQFSPGDYNVEKAFGWLIDPTYLSRALRTVPPAGGSEYALSLAA